MTVFVLLLFSIFKIIPLLLYSYGCFSRDLFKLNLLLVGTGYSNSSAKLSSKTLDEMNAMAMNTWSSESLVPCENCGRKFLPEKLIIHRRSCTSLNPSRRVGESVNAAQRSKYEESESYDMESRYFH
jgi:hypothetical protein